MSPTSTVQGAVERNRFSKGSSLGGLTAERLNQPMQWTVLNMTICSLAGRALVGQH